MRENSIKDIDTAIKQVRKLFVYEHQKSKKFDAIAALKRIKFRLIEKEGKQWH